MIIIAALGFLTLAGCNNNHHSQVRKFKQTAEKTNRSCPTRMNETITLDSTRYDAVAFYLIPNNRYSEWRC